MNTPWAIAFGALWVVVLLNAVVTVGVLRRIGNILERTEALMASGTDGLSLGGVPVGVQVEEFRVFENRGNHKVREIKSAELIRAPTILLFMGAHCGPCREIGKDLKPSTDEIDGVPFVPVLYEEEGRPDWLPAGVRAVYQRQEELSRAFQNIATPQA
jgi:hypothetical protein